MLTTILSSAENFFHPNMFVCFFYCFTVEFICFSFCLSHEFYVHVVKVYVLGVRMFMVSSCMFYIVFAMLVEILSSAEN